MSNRSLGTSRLAALVLTVLLALGAGAGPAAAQAPAEVKVGLLVPLSGLYARPGQVMRMGAEMAVEQINAQGGIKALGGARLRLVVLDSGDTTEKAKKPPSAWWPRRPTWWRPPAPT
jgi:branched-chain amino acid transport system substrate-binding protein